MSLSDLSPHSSLILTPKLIFGSVLVEISYGGLTIVYSCLPDSLDTVVKSLTVSFYPVVVATRHSIRLRIGSSVVYK